jgi:hypothetical protein
MFEFYNAKNKCLVFEMISTWYIYFKLYFFAININYFINDTKIVRRHHNRDTILPSSKNFQAVKFKIVTWCLWIVSRFYPIVTRFSWPIYILARKLPSHISKHIVNLPKFTQNINQRIFTFFHTHNHPCPKNNSSLHQKILPRLNT